MIGCKAGTGTASADAPKLESEDQKTLCALGMILGRNVKPFALKPEELAIVKAGISDAVNDAKPQIEIETYGPKVSDLATRRADSGAEEAKKKGQEFADKAARMPFENMISAPVTETLLRRCLWPNNKRRMSCPPPIHFHC